MHSSFQYVFIASSFFQLSLWTTTVSANIDADLRNEVVPRYAAPAITTYAYHELAWTHEGNFLAFQQPEPDPDTYEDELPEEAPDLAAGPDPDIYDPEEVPDLGPIPAPAEAPWIDPDEYEYDENWEESAEPDPDIYDPEEVPDLGPIPEPAPTPEPGLDDYGGDN